MSEKNIAVALKWDKQLPAPQVIAKGEGLLVDSILQLASDHGVEVIKDPMLAGVLSQQEVMDLIPVDLYEVVAKILSTVYNLSVTKEEEII